MGKASRLRSQREAKRAENDLREVGRSARKADRRGRRVPPTIAAYERLASLDSERVIEALIARSTARMEKIPVYSDQLKAEMISCLAPITWIDRALIKYGANPLRPPSVHAGALSDRLLWGSDSAVAASRLMLCLQFVGAAAIARNQLERWVINRSVNAGIEQVPGESMQEFIARAWSSPDHGSGASSKHAESSEKRPDFDEFVPSQEPTVEHSHVKLSSGEEVCPATLYGLLSELMHGREMVEALYWETDGVLSGDSFPDEAAIAVGVAADAISLSLREVRSAVEKMAKRRNDVAILGLLAHPFDRFSLQCEHESTGEGAAKLGATPSPDRLVTPPLAALMPLTPREGLSELAVGIVQRMAFTHVATMSGQRPAGRLFRDDEFTAHTFAWHRSRSIRTAQRGLAQEREKFGVDFNEESLSLRTMRFGVLSEAAAIVALWQRGTQGGAALIVVASALRSAHWLWLEDDHRAMAILRCVLEQVARARVWRTKPEKARLLEGRTQTSPRDWLETAGWKRLRALNNALGEFAHMSVGSRWTGAHELLALLQIDVDEDTAIYTARGAALEFVSVLVAEEVIESAKGLSVSVALAFANEFKRIGLVDQSGAPVEQRFNHIWRQRMVDLGDSDFSIGDDVVDCSVA